MIQFQLRTLFIPPLLFAVFYAADRIFSPFSYPTAPQIDFSLVVSECSFVLFSLVVISLRWRRALWGLLVLPVVCFIIHLGLFYTGILYLGLLFLSGLSENLALGVMLSGAYLAPAALLGSIVLIQRNSDAQGAGLRASSDALQWLAWLSLFLATAACGVFVRVRWQLVFGLE